MGQDDARLGTSLAARPFWIDWLERTLLEQSNIRPEDKNCHSD
jgi:hypothetical protein